MPKSNPLDRYAKLHKFIEKRLKEDVYAEPPSELHTHLTHTELKHFDERFGLRGKHVLDVGCGQGVALEKFLEYGATAKGITFGEDFEICRKKGYDVHEMDMSFLEFDDGTFDLIWARHALEHSLFPFFTLDGFFAALKEGGLLYVEVPAPDTSAQHQTNKNHYACLTFNSWASLFHRAGFAIIDSFNITLNLTCGPDLYFTYYLQKPGG